MRKQFGKVTTHRRFRHARVNSSPAAELLLREKFLRRSLYLYVDVCFEPRENVHDERTQQSSVQERGRFLSLNPPTNPVHPTLVVSPNPTPLPEPPCVALFLARVMCICECVYVCVRARARMCIFFFSFFLRKSFYRRRARIPTPLPLSTV